MMHVTRFDKGCPRSGNSKIMFSVDFAYAVSLDMRLTRIGRVEMAEGGVRA
jgi:hypothetical protein